MHKLMKVPFEINWTKFDPFATLNELMQMLTIIC